MSLKTKQKSLLTESGRSGIDDLIINVDGTGPASGGSETLTNEDGQAVLDLNLPAAVRLDRGFLPGVMERKSKILIHFSSVSYRLPFAHYGLAYAARTQLLPLTAKVRQRWVHRMRYALTSSRLGLSKPQEHMDWS
jgi:NAD(P)-dependent dehydrogenase (short-subunit alcohol dehydrogenase family)